MPAMLAAIAAALLIGVVIGLFFGAVFAASADADRAPRLEEPGAVLDRVHGGVRLVP